MINERGAEQKIVEMVQRRGVVVVRLMDQSGGRDDRQLLLLPPGAHAEATAAEATAAEATAAAGGRDAEASRRTYGVFPNVPYEEKKYE